MRPYLWIIVSINRIQKEGMLTSLSNAERSFHVSHIRNYNLCTSKVTSNCSMLFAKYRHIQFTPFWYVILCRFVDKYRSFGETCCFHNQLGIWREQVSVKLLFLLKPNSITSHKTVILTWHIHSL